MKSYIQELMKGIVFNKDNPSSPEKDKDGKKGEKIKSSSFVIQKYIEKPLLIDDRKFDVWVWVFMSQDFKIYMFKEGYIRTSGAKFSLNDCDEAQVHLTNNAI